MAIYKTVMRPALEYASSIWLPLASSTSINKLQVMQNAAFRIATGCTQDTNIQHLHDETLTLPIHEHYSPTPQNTNRKHNIFQQWPIHNKHSNRPLHSHHNRHKNTHAPYYYNIFIRAYKYIACKMCTVLNMVHIYI